MAKLDVCSLCGGALEDTTVSQFTYYQAGQGMVVFEDVPAQKCTDCGEEFYGIEILKAVENVMKKGLDPPKTTEITVPCFPRNVYMPEIATANESVVKSEWR